MLEWAGNHKGWTDRSQNNQRWFLEIQNCLLEHQSNVKCHGKKRKACISLGHASENHMKLTTCQQGAVNYQTRPGQRLRQCQRCKISDSWANWLGHPPAELPPLPLTKPASVLNPGSAIHCKNLRRGQASFHTTVPLRSALRLWLFTDKHQR